MNIKLRADFLQIVEEILTRFVPEYEVRVFGSRANGTPKKYSDLDLVIMTEKSLEIKRMAFLKNAFSESNLPIKVDIVDWSSIDKGFKDIIDDESVPFLPAGRE